MIHFEFVKLSLKSIKCNKVNFKIKNKVNLRLIKLNKLDVLGSYEKTIMIEKFVSTAL